MQMNLIKWSVLFSLIHSLKGSRIVWKLNEFVPLERTLKTILESCYENDSSTNPLLIVGDFSEFIENSSIIRINDFRTIAFRDDKLCRRFDFKASRVVLVEDSPEKLDTDLNLLSRIDSDVWNHMTSFIIVAKYKGGCEDFKYLLNLSWSKNMINSIYICPESLNNSVLYTLNLMANYAPYPWEKMEESIDLNVFRQVFDQRISCKNLNYDKTKQLNGYEIKIVGERDENSCFFPSNNDCEFENINSLADKPLQIMISALNISGRFEEEDDFYTIIERRLLSELDIMSDLYSLSSVLQGNCFLLPYMRAKLIGVVKLEPEVTTLHKILNLWSTPVLIAAAIALAFLFFTLIIKNHDFALAILDVVRLLTYTSVRTNVQTHAFRIYFTTMLLFMVISNGVFQGKIAAFLTTRERASAIGTINQLADLGYEMFAVDDLSEWLNEQCPKCNFKSASPQECIEHVLSNTHHLCAIWERLYHAEYSQSDLDQIPDVLDESLIAYGCGRHWPLENHFSDGLSRIFQTGILDYWERRLTDVPKQKRMAREAEWASTKYRPVELYKLKFAFQMVALGLLISTTVFLLEVHEGYYD